MQAEGDLKRDPARVNLPKLIIKKRFGFHVFYQLCDCSQGSNEEAASFTEC